MLSLECETCDKSYRNTFLFSYRILYEKLQYLPDILEFALEGKIDILNDLRNFLENKIS
jgi:hypothetical protein